VVIVTRDAGLALPNDEWDAFFLVAQDQFHTGLSTINLALETALRQRGGVGGVVTYDTQATEPRDTQFSVTVDGKAGTQMFARQEIEDSAQVIDAPSATRPGCQAPRLPPIIPGIVGATCDGRRPKATRGRRGEGKSLRDDIQKEKTATA
jgi:hypothetical protein